MSLEKTVDALHKYGLSVTLRDATHINVAKHNDTYYVWPTENGTLSLRQQTDSKYARANIHWVNNHLSIRIDEIQTIKLYRKQPDIMGVAYETYEIPEQMLVGDE